MAEKADLYNTSYGNYADEMYRQIRVETYGEDLGQTSWMSLDEFRKIIQLLEVNQSSRVLEIGSGSGGSALHLAETVGCRVVGVDVNEAGVKNGNALAKSRNLEALARFDRCDAGKPLPFDDESFDAIYSNDAICHIPGRLSVLNDWHRLLKPGGRIAFSDALVVTGALSDEELATRSSIGYYLFVPPGENERLIKEAGFRLLRAEDVTEAAAALSQRRRDSRAKRADKLSQIEGEANFAGLQKFLACVHSLSSERRLSRFLYVARK